MIVKTTFSAISAGTELLVYRGQAPADLVRDTRLEALSGTFSFPLKYGYAAVGEVVSLGPGVDLHWEEKGFFISASSELFCGPRVGSYSGASDDGASGRCFSSQHGDRRHPGSRRPARPGGTGGRFRAGCGGAAGHRPPGPDTPGPPPNLRPARSHESNFRATRRPPKRRPGPAFSGRNDFFSPGFRGLPGGGPDL